MNIQNNQTSDPKDAVNKMLSDIKMQREAVQGDRSIELSQLTVRAAELKFGVDQLGKQNWVQTLCSLLKDTGEVVICSQRFANHGYPNNGECFFLATGQGIRIGFNTYTFSSRYDHDEFRWPELAAGQLLQPIHLVPESDPITSTIRHATLSIRHRAPSSLMGLRQFNYLYAADSGITPAEIEENLLRAASNLQEREGGTNKA